MSSRGLNKKPFFLKLLLHFASYLWVYSIDKFSFFYIKLCKILLHIIICFISCKKLSVLIVFYITMTLSFYR